MPFDDFPTLSSESSNFKRKPSLCSDRECCGACERNQAARCPTCQRQVSFSAAAVCMRASRLCGSRKRQGPFDRRTRSTSVELYSLALRHSLARPPPPQTSTREHAESRCSLCRSWSPVLGYPSLLDTLQMLARATMQSPFKSFGCCIREAYVCPVYNVLACINAPVSYN